MLMSMSSGPFHFVHYSDSPSMTNGTHGGGSSSTSPSSSSSSTIPSAGSNKRHKKNDPAPAGGGSDSPSERKKPFERKGQEKLQHNAAERRRKQKFNAKLTELHELLPSTGKQTKPSKIRILERAVDYTRQLHSQLAALEEKNRLLQIQLESSPPLRSKHGGESSLSPSHQTPHHQVGVPLDQLQQPHTQPQPHSASSYEQQTQHHQHRQQQQQHEVLHHLGGHLHQQPSRHQLLQQQQHDRESEAMLNLARASAALHHAPSHHHQQQHQHQHQLQYQQQQQQQHQMQQMQQFQQLQHFQQFDTSQQHHHQMMQEPSSSPPSSSNSPLSMHHHHGRNANPYGVLPTSTSPSSSSATSLQMHLAAHLSSMSPEQQTHLSQVPILPPLRSLQALSLPAPIMSAASPLHSGGRGYGQATSPYSPPSSPTSPSVSASASASSSSTSSSGHSLHQHQQATHYSAPSLFPPQSWSRQ